MKNIIRLALILIILFLLSGCVSVPMAEEGLVIGQSYRLGSGKTLNNDLTVIGGNAVLDEDSTVNGDVAVLGGNVTINGTVNGEVSVLGGYVYLDDNAVVKGSVNSLGGTVQRSDQAVIEGKSAIETPATPRITTMRTPNMQISFDPITGPLMAIFQGLALAALAVLATLFIPAHMERTGKAVVSQPFGSGGVGCLTLLVLVVMTITIILIPVSAIGFVAAGIAALFGWLAMGLILGRQIAVWLKQTWTEPVSAGVGTMVRTLVASLINIIPCIGWTFSIVLGLAALGAVVLTRFGTQVYPSPYAHMSAPRPGPYTPPPAANAPQADSSPAPKQPDENQPSDPA